jgi:hypothetical protein
MKRSYFASPISLFLETPDNVILGILADSNEFSLEISQRTAWTEQIDILRSCLKGMGGHIFFEYSIPRMGRRIDVVLVIRNLIIILEFKVGEKEFLQSGMDQVMDYALDLKNFHETSHKEVIVPILVATNAKDLNQEFTFSKYQDDVFRPLKSNKSQLRAILQAVLENHPGFPIDPIRWMSGRYSPTPTIIEAAMALYSQHQVEEITRNDAAATNLTYTSSELTEVIYDAKRNNKKAICFVTGVPGAGKTLVGLKIATKNVENADTIGSVFLSGNGPLVAILREALASDRVIREKEAGLKPKKGEIMSKVKVFIQNVHHFRDECLTDIDSPPFDHVAIFDEAQRAWNLEQTAKFMVSKKGHLGFSQSEPQFLISCLDRHKDWAVIICLVGGGQEINTGEAGIKEWFESLERSFPHWDVHVSENIIESEYAAGNALEILKDRKNLVRNPGLHLSVSMRSFRAENLSHFVKCMLDLDSQAASMNLNALREKYPIVLTRDIERGKKWLREMARGNERYGIVVSSQAQRLKPYAIDVKSPIDPVHWFLKGKEDVRSSYYLEDVATEFHVQGLELDWACVAWDADFRFNGEDWETFSFVGSKWQKISKAERKIYLKNAYRVLLTRARQGMVILIPSGNSEDPTRPPHFYDATYSYLKSLGIAEL